MYYEINVSLKGEHYFATAPRSLPQGEEAKVGSMLLHFSTVFPKDQGYSVTLSRHIEYGEQVMLPKTLVAIEELVEAIKR